MPRLVIFPFKKILSLNLATVIILFNLANSNSRIQIDEMKKKLIGWFLLSWGNEEWMNLWVASSIDWMNSIILRSNGLYICGPTHFNHSSLSSTLKLFYLLIQLTFSLSLLPPQEMITFVFNHINQQWNVWLMDCLVWRRQREKFFN